MRFNRSILIVYITEKISFQNFLSLLCYVHTFFARGAKHNITKSRKEIFIQMYQKNVDTEVL